MANSQYDLDLSGGLMPQIQALLAPPSLEDISKEKRKEGLALHPYYRRPGRGHNRDSCDACKEGGGLICCDACPASFHLQCHDPPLEEATLPLGEWLCHSCRTRKAEGNVEPLRVNESDEEDFDSDTNKNGKRSRSSGIRGKLKIGGRATPVSLVKRRRTDNSEEADCEQKMKCEKNSESEEPKGNTNKTSIMGPLIKVAASMNPEQFELPSELIEHVNFPGTSKVYSKKSGSGPRKKSYELDNGMVPLPLRACFYCNKSCRKAPMVACDYCSLVFHLDCLDPPLVCMPVGKWMCPNHPQNIEYKLLPNACLTERVKLLN